MINENAAFVFFLFYFIFYWKRLITARKLVRNQFLFNCQAFFTILKHSKAKINRFELEEGKRNMNSLHIQLLSIIKLFNFVQFSPLSNLILLQHCLELTCQGLCAHGHNYILCNVRDCTRKLFSDLIVMFILKNIPNVYKFVQMLNLLKNHYAATFYCLL